MLTPLFTLDRASGLLAAQLLSSQTVGTFQFNTASALGTQSWNMPSGYKAVLTIENEQILVSALSIAGAVVTATIDTRGYNNTQAATHASNTSVEIHANKAVLDSLFTFLKQFDEGGLIIPTSFSTLPTITSASVHSYAGADLTSIFVAGRAYLFKIGSTWYRSVVRSSSYGGGNTTINISGDGLPGSGTIVLAGFEFTQSIYGGVDYELLKNATNAPASNPPSGYSWLYVIAGNWYSKDSSGLARFLTPVRASVSSSGGVLTLDCSTAKVFDCTLTENITGITWSNGIEGETYLLRLKQHASAAKTVVPGTSGGTRYSNTLASFTMTPDLSAIDELEFKYHGTDTKWDLFKVTQGFQSSPTQASAEPTGTLVAGENITAGQPLYVKASDGKAYRAVGTGDESTYNYIGIATATVLSGANVSFWKPGAIASGLSGLTAGSHYFITDTAGTIGTTPGTRIARIGVALSTTTMQVIQPKFIARGEVDVTATGNTVVTCGFYPAYIRLVALNDATANVGPSIGDDSNNCISHGAGTGAGHWRYSSGYAIYCYDWNVLGIRGRAIVSAKSSTGFTLNFDVQTGSTTTHVMWEAHSS